MENSGPAEVEGTATFPQPLERGLPTRSDTFDNPVTFRISCRFPNGVEVVLHDENNGILFEAEHGRLFVNRGRLTADPPDLLAWEDLPVAIVELCGGREPGDHMAHFFDRLRDRGTPVSDAFTHHRTVTTARSPPHGHHLPPRAHRRPARPQAHLGRGERGDRRRRRGQRLAEPRAAEGLRDRDLIVRRETSPRAEMDIKLRLADGGRMPAVGLGIWKVGRAAAPGLVEAAIRAGYRHLDSASDYGNEAEVGAGIRAALAAGLCRREDLWVTSKLWNTYHAPEHVRPAAERTLRDLGLDHLDLYLIHFPIALRFVPFEDRYPPEWVYDPAVARPRMEPAAVPLAETWGAMEDLVSAGLVRRIGVCNYGMSLLRDLLAYARVRPATLQVELHPHLTQEKLVRFCRENGIGVTAFSPLGAPSYVPLDMATPAESVLEDPAVREAARRHGRTPAQVVLRWAVQRGTTVIPKTSRPERLLENLALFDFELTDDEMRSIAALDRGRRFNDPGVFCERAFGTFFPIYE